MRRPPERTLSWVKQVQQFWQHARISQAQLLGQLEIVRGPYLFKDSILVGSKAGIQQVLVNQQDKFENSFPEGCIRSMGPDQLLSRDGAPHRRMRESLQPAVTMDRVLAHLPAIHHIAEKRLQAWEGKRLLANQQVKLLAFDVICNVFGGMQLSEQQLMCLQKDFGVLVANWLYPDVPFSPFKKSMEARRRLLAVIQPHVHALMLEQQSASQSAELVEQQQQSAATSSISCIANGHIPDTLSEHSREEVNTSCGSSVDPSIGSDHEAPQNYTQSSESHAVSTESAGSSGRELQSHQPQTHKTTSVRRARHVTLAGSGHPAQSGTCKKTSSILHSLIASQAAGGVVPLTESEIVDNFLLMLQAGHSSVGTTLMLALKQLGDHPEAHQKLHEEQVSVQASWGQAITAQCLTEMPYLEAFMKEVWRMDPTLSMLFRTAKEDVMVEGHIIPKGSAVLTAMRHASHTEDHWNDCDGAMAPACFNPDRWLHPDAPKWSPLLIFGGGHRMCLGFNLAMVEIKVVLALLARHYRIELLGGRDWQVVFNMVCKDGMPAILHSIRDEV